jgi:MFS family permease
MIDGQPQPRRVADAVNDGLRRLPGGIWALGFTSLFMDTSSELIHSLLPVFLVTTLGASTTTIGLIEGVAEAATAITKVFSGTLSDYLGKRKVLVVIGYGLGALTKPFFPLAGGVTSVVAARVIDRIGKGIRGAPRDALVADLAPPELHGSAYGLRQALDTVGAFVGPLLAVVLMALLASDIRAVFWAAVVPAFVSVGLLIVAVPEPEHHPDKGVVRAPIALSDLARLPRPYWLVVSLGGILTLARFSEAFLILRADSIGMPALWVPFVLIVMNVVYSLAAFPAGVAADVLSRRGLLALGLAALVAADLLLAAASSVTAVLGGVALWGLHMGLTQGLLATLVAAAAPASLRGTAFGLFNLTTGVVLLIASFVAGLLWSAIGPSATFLAGATFTTAAMIGLLFLVPDLESRGSTTRRGHG